MSALVGGYQWETKQRNAASDHRQVLEAAPLPPTSTGACVMTNLTTGSAATITLPAGTTSCELSVDSGDVRLTKDGTAPTASTGLYLPNGFYDPDFKVPTNGTLKVIRVDSTENPNVATLPNKYDGA